MIINMTGGGSGGGLNLSVVGGTTQPAGKENTIWVNTDTAINGYAFSATEPTSPVEGMVWFATGTSASAPINIDKKHLVIIYPNSCMQYISGAWVSKTAMTYLDGAWVDWRGYLYSLGNMFEDITGGYKMTGYNGVGVENTTAGITITKTTDTGDKYAIIASNNPIDFSQRKQLCFEVNLNDNNISFTVGVSNESAGGTLTASTEWTGSWNEDISGQRTLVVDISSIDAGYVYVKAYQAYGTICDIYTMA